MSIFSRVTQTLTGLYFWFCAVLFTFLFFSAVYFMHMWLVFTGRPHETRPLHRICSNWGRLLIRIMPGWRVSVIDAENIPATEEPFVVVANHESMADIWAMFCLDLQFRWLSKEEVFNIPFVGPAMKWTGYVPIKRGDRESHAAAMKESIKRLREGLSMFYFPEGTRSHDGRIKTFKTGAFKLARDEQVRVLPVAIHGARGLLPKGALMPGRSHIKVQVLPPIPPPDKSDLGLEDYAADVRKKIISVHQGLL